MARVFNSISLGIALGAAIASAAFVAGARIPAPGAAQRSTDPFASTSAQSSARSTTPRGGGAVLADSDADAVLAELARIDDPRSQRVAALALLEAFGSDKAGIDRIAAALPPADRLNFTFDAIAMEASRDPVGAIATALALEHPAAQTEAIARIATALAAVDPRTALGNVTAIANYRLADTFRIAVLEEWANVDPDGFFTFLETASPRDISSRSDAFRIAASSDPDRLLTLINSLPQAGRSQAELAGLEALVRIDPASAFAYLEAMPGGSARNSLMTATVRSLALHDMEAALAWLDSRPSTDPAAISGVLGVLAETDRLRAVDMLIAHATSLGNTSAFSAAIDAFTPGPREELALVADRLSAVDNSAIQVALSRFMELWSTNDAEAALDWTLANADRLNTEATAALARNLSVSNPELAKQAAMRLPRGTQDVWIRAVAQQLARNDIDGTLRWLAQYQGQPYYEPSVQAALLGRALYGSSGDAQSLAAFLERQSPELRASSAPAVAYVWAGSDPRAAAQWAERIDLGSADESRRRAALANVAGQWGLRDPDGARDWVLGLPQGTNRDQVLGSLLQTTAAAGRIDTSVLDGYSSDESRRQYVAGVMYTLGRSNPELGRTLIDRYLDDPAARAQAEQRLIQGAASEPYTTSGGAGMYP